MHHIIHDIDRDGWGSASLLLAGLGHNMCRIYPTGQKDIRNLLGKLRPKLNDTIWVLDIPAPPSWTNFRSPECARLVWVDHHMDAWQNKPPENIEVHLPSSTRSTTTMHLLLEHALVDVAHARPFVSMLCRDSAAAGWGAVFDGLNEIWPNIRITEDNLRKHLSSAVSDALVPDDLGFAIKKADSTRSTVQAVLDSSDMRCLDMLVIVRLEDAHKIPLSRYSLAAGRRHPGKAIVLVHRNQRLYCGRNSRQPGLDFIRHFKSRRFDPKGHPYVCTVSIPDSKIEKEVDMLVETMEALPPNHQVDHLKQVLKWAERIRGELQPILNSHLGRVHFRPSSTGVAMIGLDHERPQRGKGGFRNLKQLSKNYEELYRNHCADCSLGRKTPEKALQSFLIREAYKNERRLSSINKASNSTEDPVELLFATDEIPVPLGDNKRIVCDLLAVRVLTNGRYRPVLLELKSSRKMRELVEQLEVYAGVVDSHRDLFSKLFSALFGASVQLAGDCEKWIVWPMAKKPRDPRQAELAKQGIRVVGYQQNGTNFSFRVCAGVNPKPDA